MEGQALMLQISNKKLTEEEERFIYSLDLETKEKCKKSSSFTYSFIHQLFLNTYYVAFAGPSPRNMINKECVALSLQEHTV